LEGAINLLDKFNKRKEGIAHMSTNKKSNRLIHEKSPYLLQHAHNPVDWYPWCEEAFEKAKAEDKPIFLSIGYSTCHWCHVMSEESFEDSETANILNKYFVCIKVDREERPDIDQIYMNICQAMTGQGGWPLSVFMTPDMKPFFIGTYFPKNDRYGIRGFIPILKRIANLWSTNKSELIQSGESIINSLSDAENEITAKSESKNIRLNSGIISDILNKAYKILYQSFDRTYGGFGTAPKFPSPHNLMFLMRYWHISNEKKAIDMVYKTLDSMRKGGIFDHIGFGFSRYSTDDKWLVPHFEKMLYDNALLLIAYTEAYSISGNELYKETAEQIIKYATERMLSPEGGFYFAEDADSEGEEGKFYLWTVDEVNKVLGPEDSKKFCSYFSITTRGNFEGKNIPNLINTNIEKLYNSEKDFIEKCRIKLFEYREKRVHPGRDEKILTSWNGLMIAALAIAGRVFDNETYIKQAEKCVNFIQTNLVNEEGRLMARYCKGETAFKAYAEDYANIIWGLVELYLSTFKLGYLKYALKLADDLVKYFWDEQNGGFYLYGSDGEQLIMRPKEIYDGAIPSANSTAAYNFIRLARLAARPDLEDKAFKIFEVFSWEINRNPQIYTFCLSALMFSEKKTREVVIVTSSRKEAEDMIKVLYSEYRPFNIPILYVTDSDESNKIKEINTSIEKYEMLKEKPTAFVCEGYQCKPPVTDINAFRELLNN